MEKIFKQIIDKIFDLAVIIKSFFGCFEILSGVVLAFSGKLVTDNFILDLARQEILEDPHDFIANYLINSANNFVNGSQLFAVLYLLVHGFVNIILIIALLKNKVWAYHSALTGFSVFIVYQVFRYFHTQSATLLLLTVFDIFVVLVIFLEYNKNKIK